MGNADTMGGSLSVSSHGYHVLTHVTSGRAAARAISAAGMSVRLWSQT